MFLFCHTIHRPLFICTCRSSAQSQPALSLTVVVLSHSLYLASLLCRKNSWLHLWNCYVQSHSKQYWSLDLTLLLLMESAGRGGQRSMCCCLHCVYWCADDRQSYPGSSGPGSLWWVPPTFSWHHQTCNIWPGQRWKTTNSTEVFCQ